MKFWRKKWNKKLMLERLEWTFIIAIVLYIYFLLLHEVCSPKIFFYLSIFSSFFYPYSQKSKIKYIQINFKNSKTLMKNEGREEMDKTKSLFYDHLPIDMAVLVCTSDAGYPSSAAVSPAR